MKDTISYFSVVFTMLAEACQKALHLMRREASRERTREQREERRKGELSLLSPPLALAFPFACCSRVTSPNSPR